MNSIDRRLAELEKRFKKDEPFPDSVCKTLGGEMLRKLLLRQETSEERLGLLRAWRGLDLESTRSSAWGQLLHRAFARDSRTIDLYCAVFGFAYWAQRTGRSPPDAYNDFAWELWERVMDPKEPDLTGSTEEERREKYIESQNDDNRPMFVLYRWQDKVCMECGLYGKV